MHRNQNPYSKMCNYPAEEKSDSMRLEKK